ncbi:pseudaminic acid cytidylyltransferase [Salegentibacter salarius]|uniref:CMP-N-acetylneuraminic acid synthetase n=1 Tax=Salegentibacter salarius TaxID=435906 RepID=A0A2N0U5G5_9FLAO|nr:pseudaminic acid cytidylyltransferase [Salegentibacter salarius]OEY73956.1 pseudaminic acid cytidylyltransferase [Salegentibacter salarius]PKD22156.1 CMP-N-acetylneuraminic acid synthetase [Salegentibacter salarius]SLJ86311.1 N-acylneuraminate cytidylyltransferase [Salegentibacter salarius]
MSNLCIIPARGGSKRIPRKNIKDFLGKPIIAYSIETALQSGLFEEVMVSTDDEGIAKVAEKLGARVPFLRSEANANDHATLADVVDEVLLHYNSKFKYVCCLLATSPLVQEKHLVDALTILQNEDFDSIRPIAKFSYPIQRAMKISKEGAVDWFYPEFIKSRSQDLEEAYHDAGQFYWMKSEKGLRSTKRGGIIIEEKYVQDIDTEEDWEIAEMKYNFLIKE